MCVETGAREPYVAGKGRHIQDLDRPQSPAVPIEVILDTPGERVALSVGESRRKVRHHCGVGVEPRERLAIRRTPQSQEESRGPDLRCMHLVPTPRVRHALAGRSRFTLRVAVSPRGKAPTGSDTIYT